jgi:hypothetical protein
MIVGGGLLMFGAVVPFAMMMRWIPSTLTLNLACAMATLFGTIIGLYGVFEYVHRGRP